MWPEDPDLQTEEMFYYCSLRQVSGFCFHFFPLINALKWGKREEEIANGCLLFGLADSF